MDTSTTNALAERAKAEHAARCPAPCRHFEVEDERVPYRVSFWAADNEYQYDALLTHREADRVVDFLNEHDDEVSSDFYVYQPRPEFDTLDELMERLREDVLGEEDE